jgi:hypothetical protein
MKGALRQAWWIPAGVVAVLAILAPCTYNAIDWIGKPFPGFLVLENGIVVSFGRSEWIPPERRRTQWTRVLAVGERPVSGGRELHDYLRTSDTESVSYTFRQGTEIFRLALRPRPFRTLDFLEVFAPMLGVGLLMMVAGAIPAIRRPEAPETKALFVLCLIISLEIVTGPDVYFPYWFTPIYYLAVCLVPPAVVQLALTYPQRSRLLRRGTLLYPVLYLPFVGLWSGILAWRSEPSLFLPLLYLVYFLTANAALLYVGRLVLALIEGLEPSRPVVLALIGAAGGPLLILAVFVSYPLLQQPISPAWALTPLLIFPILSGRAFRLPAPAASARPPVHTAV